MAGGGEGDGARFWRGAALGFAALALALALLAAWALARGFTVDPIPVPGREPPAPVAPPPPRLDLEPARFDALPGWRADRHDQALAAFVASCDRLGAARGELCAAARRVPADAAAARAFFERAFEPYAASNRSVREGLLTGYYEPELAGRRRRRPPFVHPLYRDPGERQVVDLGEFKRDLEGRKITGFFRGGRFRPYWDRREIERGALGGRGLELAWVADPIALFFLQIQGSGRIRLEDDTLLRVGYAGQNGHDYTAIGRVLVERGELELEQVSLQSIRAWLQAHPAEADQVMDANRSYVFFRPLSGPPVGAAGVELTPGRSLAVDPAFWPYGLPLWLETTLPAVPEAGAAAAPRTLLAIAQDTGGAIRGPLRADLFFGPGAAAEEVAGRMRQPLRLWALWPRGAGPPPAPPTPRRGPPGAAGK